MVNPKNRSARIVGALVITTCIMLGIVWLLGHLLLALNPNGGSLIASEPSTSVTELAKNAVSDTAAQLGLQSTGDVGSASSATAKSSISDTTSDANEDVDSDADTDADPDSELASVSIGESDSPVEPDATFNSGSTFGSDTSFETGEKALVDVSSQTGIEDAEVRDADTGDSNPDWLSVDQTPKDSPSGTPSRFDTEAELAASDSSPTSDAISLGTGDDGLSTESSELESSELGASELGTSELGFKTDNSETVTPEKANVADTSSAKLEVASSPRPIEVISPNTPPRFRPPPIERRVMSATNPVAGKAYPVRVWTSNDNKQVEASFVRRETDAVILSVRGKLYRVPLTRFGQADLQYLKSLGQNRVNQLRSQNQ